MSTSLSYLRSIVVLGRENDLSFLAGSIAFFAFISLIPALILAFALSSLVGGEEFATGIGTLLEAYLSQGGNTVLSDALSNPSGQVGASVAGSVALLWGTFKVFRAVDVAFDRIYGTENRSSLPRQLLNALLVVGTIATGLSLIVGIELLVVRLEVGVYRNLVSVPLLVLGLFVILAPLYYVMPPRPVTPLHIVPGTVTAVGGVVVLQQMFHVYASLAGRYQAYGLIGAVLLFLLWLYFGALILLLGAVINVAIEQ